jgi:hypothetical protein
MWRAERRLAEARDCTKVKKETEIDEVHMVPNSLVAVETHPRKNSESRRGV